LLLIEQGEKHQGLLRDGEVDAGGLRDEDSARALVEAGASRLKL